MSNSKSGQFLTFSIDLKSIPIWPSLFSSSTKPLIPASNALIAVNNDLLVPWMKDNHRFIDPQFSTDSRRRACLNSLGAEKLSAEILLRDYVLPLPQTLDDRNWKYFQPLIGATFGVALSPNVAQTTLALLRRSRIAADGNRNLKVPSELFDHQDQLFISAFRYWKETSFLHSSLQNHRLFWLKVGLRQRASNSLVAADYLQCLRAIKVRLNAENLSSDQHLDEDIREVLSPLTTPSSSTRAFSAPDWEAVSQERVFRSKVVFISEPRYRQSTMAAVSARQRLLSLSDIIVSEHVAVCWSQNPFPVYQPTREVLAMISGNGRPKTDTVWRHLLHLKDLALHLRQDQLSDFLADLCKTYEYLQDHLQSSVGFNLQDNAVWLNLNSLDANTLVMDEMRSSWYGTKDLVLSSSCDAGPIKAVKPGLMYYEKLLRAVGCDSISHPIVTCPDPHPDHSLASQLRVMWKKEELVDITFSTQGRLIKAHRLILAALSDKFAAQFSGRWTIEDVIKYDEDDDPDEFLSYHTLLTMLQYAYEDPIDWKQMQVKESDDVADKARKLNLLLDLLKGTSFWLIEGLKSQVERRILAAGKDFITIKNVIEVRELAERAEGKVVEEMCAKFIERNREAVARAHAGKLQ